MSTVALIFGGRSVEHEVSVSSARTISRALEKAGHTVIPTPIAMDGKWAAAARGQEALDGDCEHISTSTEGPFAGLFSLLHTYVDVAFPTVHGTWGEDGTLQGLLEMIGLPYVGCGVAASAVAMDKGLAKSVLAAAGLSVVEGEVVTREDFSASASAVMLRLERMPMPVFVKPCIGGSSVGIVKTEVEGLEAAVQHALGFDDRIVVERAVNGRELECAVLGYRTFEASAIGEIVPGREFYDYADKYLEDGARLHAPAPLDDHTVEQIRELALAAFSAIGGWGMARVDFLLETNGDLFVNEINTLPGFTDISMYPRLWEVAGIPLPNLVDRLVTIALDRHSDRQRLDGGIKAFIESLS